MITEGLQDRRGQFSRLFLVFNETELPKLGWLCLIVLPAFSWLAGYLTITLAFPAGPNGKVVSTPRLGAVINLLPMVLMVVFVVILFFSDVVRG